MKSILLCLIVAVCVLQTMSEGNQVNNLNLEADKQIVVIHNHGNLTVNRKDKTSPTISTDKQAMQEINTITNKCITAVKNNINDKIKYGHDCQYCYDCPDCYRVAEKKIHEKRYAALATVVSCAKNSSKQNVHTCYSSATVTFNNQANGFVKYAKECIITRCLNSKFV
ncbi:uncharacterized protein LOC127283208 [Leptopilina boulardi]|uniref:uncharacterized protein LOC127283208 n=1 Tax=Leptopilina boulardi TaxID=63433 RepID=UPI0021F6172F|nr:uncharacterized protein LOC127283208 [Leptopilina boulardi]